MSKRSNSRSRRFFQYARCQPPVIESLETRALFSAAIANTGGAPNGPYAMTATAAAPAGVQLSFYDSADNETGFVVERAAGGGGGAFTAVGTVDASVGVHGVVSYVDPSAVPGATYAYRVYAVNGSVYQSAITPAATITLPGTTPVQISAGGAPNGPYAIAASALSSTSAQVTYYDSADNETGFVIERSEAGGPFVKATTAAAHTDANRQVTFVDTGLTPGQTYAYRVYAVNGPYASSIGGPAAVTLPTGVTPPVDPVYMPSVPDAPYGISIGAADASGAAVSFYDSATTEAGFAIEREGLGDATFTPLATLPASAGRDALVTYQDATAQPNVQYVYRVYAFDGPYESSYSTVINFIPLQMVTTTTINPVLTNTGGTLTLNPINVNQIIAQKPITPITLTPPNVDVGSSGTFGTYTGSGAGIVVTGGTLNLNTGGSTLQITNNPTTFGGTLQAGTLIGATMLNNGTLTLNNSSSSSLVSGTTAGTISFGSGSAGGTWKVVDLRGSTSLPGGSLTVNTPTPLTLASGTSLDS